MFTVQDLMLTEAHEWANVPKFLFLYPSFMVVVSVQVDSIKIKVVLMG